ncbi:MAG: HAD superfamily hydrolase [Candidatus Methanohalarchaeum thermophilum]|uniref:HAD superfamily hydrolase n=1 Tax=Methanohalarchaeum thermophilum TaxID=1903181 RepID=A0A1Q6DS82_METT1|nr:MAG: HAD superfamily hydrolase [Candidatus Methanohalarchaeum thermophilum]
MKISIDMDGVLAETQKAFIKDFNSRYDYSYTLEDIGDYDCECAPFSKRTLIEVTNKLWKDDWECISPTEDNLRRKVKKICEISSRVDIVTARMKREKQMKSWLEMHGIYEDEHYSDFIREAEKHDLGHDFYIDDNPYYHGKVNKLFLYSRPWNMEVKEENGTERVYSLDEARSGIERLAKRTLE